MARVIKTGYFVHRTELTWEGVRLGWVLGTLKEEMEHSVDVCGVGMIHAYKV